jgi:hypothetical protein
VPGHVVEQLLIDVLMIDVQALCEPERGLLAVGEVTARPTCDLRDRFFLETSSP